MSLSEGIPLEGIQLGIFRDSHARSWLIKYFYHDFKGLIII